MSLARGRDYATAGLTGMQAERFQVNNGVYVLDGMAGQRYDSYDGAVLGPDAADRPENYGISARRALMMLVGTAVILLFLIAFNAVRIRQAAYQVSVTEEQVRALAQTNRQLDLDILEVRDMTRISYQAVQTLGMIPVEEAPCYSIVVPDTRPFSN